MYKTLLPITLLTLFSLTPTKGHFNSIHTIRFDNVNLTNQPYDLFIDLDYYHQYWLNNVTGYIIYSTEPTPYHTELNLPKYVLCNKDYVNYELICDINSNSISKAYLLNDSINGPRLVLDIDYSSVIKNMENKIMIKVSFMFCTVVLLLILTLKK